MNAQPSPSTAPSEQYGPVEGTVTSGSAFPVRPRASDHRLGSVLEVTIAITGPTDRQWRQVDVGQGATSPGIQRHADDGFGHPGLPRPARAIGGAACGVRGHPGREQRSGHLCKPLAPTASFPRRITRSAQLGGGLLLGSDRATSDVHHYRFVLCNGNCKDFPMPDFAVQHWPVGE
jgi:hypothetical protein